MTESILFYTSAQPGAAPFVRVPATPEGLRYAGYLARYKGVPPFRGGLSTDHITDVQQQAYLAGYHDYPRNPDIPLGTERYVGNAVWCRLDHRDAGEIANAARPGNGFWVIVPEGAPPPRAA